MLNVFAGGGEGLVEHGNRKDLVLTALAWINESPFLGHGVGTILERDDFTALPHNAQLLLWIEGGVISLLGSILLFGGLFYQAYSTRAGVRRYAMALCLILFGYWQVRTHAYQVFIFLPVVMAVILGTVSRQVGSRVPAESAKSSR